MSSNLTIARLFDEMADALEITGADVFRVNAHRRVARSLLELPGDVADLGVDEASLTAIDGIGTGSARRIMEFLKTGRIADHDRLLERVPRGVLDLLGIPGLGPKTARTLWEQGGVSDLASLKAKLATEELAGLPRLGPKVLQKISESIAFKERAAQRVRLGQALPLAEAIVERLASCGAAQKVSYAGSLRRGRETVGDLDIVATTRDPAALAQVFTSMPGVEQVQASGPTKVSVRLESGLQVDLRMVEESSWGAALLYFTGSKDHNVALRERAVKRGMRLNEYGLFAIDPADGSERLLASATEEEIYARLELPWIDPERREDRGEFANQLPRLIELGDVKAELHAHTVASDGHFTIETLIAEAIGRGFHTIAVTDHSASSVQANGLSVERLLAHIAAVRRAGEANRDITVLAGAEVDILTDGRLDYTDDVVEQLDLVIASPHAALRQDSPTCTQRLLRAVTHPLVHILGHPTGRLIGQREGLTPDIDVLAKAAASHGTALEVNANSWRLDLRDTHVRAAMAAGGLLCINTDAHGPADFDQLRYGVLTARRGWLTAQRCLNTWSRQDLAAWLARKRSRPAPSA